MRLLSEDAAAADAEAAGERRERTGGETNVWLAGGFPNQPNPSDPTTASPSSSSSIPEATTRGGAFPTLAVQRRVFLYIPDFKDE